MQRVIMSSELIRRPSISKIQARIGEMIRAELSMLVGCFSALHLLLETLQLITELCLLYGLAYSGICEAMFY